METTLSPTELLRLLKKIEAIVGRVPSIRNGPRAVDLDVVFYDGIVYDTRADKQASLEGELVVPHPLMQEREFVLRPLAESVTFIVIFGQLSWYPQYDPRLRSSGPSKICLEPAQASCSA